jgi:hypothetical protein
LSAAIGTPHAVWLIDFLQIALLYSMTVS